MEVISLDNTFEFEVYQKLDGVFAQNIHIQSPTPQINVPWCYGGDRAYAGTKFLILGGTVMGRWIYAVA